jgi:hypothetical protein
VIITEDDADTDDTNEDEVNADDNSAMKIDMQGSEGVTKRDKGYLADIEGDGGYDTDATEIVNMLDVEGMGV